METRSSFSNAWNSFLRETHFLILGNKYHEDGSIGTTYTPVRTAAMSVICLANLFGATHSILVGPTIYSVVIPGFVAGWTGATAVREQLKERTITRYKKKLLAHLRKLDNNLSLKDVKLRGVEIGALGKITAKTLDINFHEGSEIEVARREVEAARREVEAFNGATSVGNLVSDQSMANFKVVNPPQTEKGYSIENVGTPEIKRKATGQGRERNVREIN